MNIAIADRDTGELIGLIGLDTIGDGGDVRIAVQEGRRVQDSTKLQEVLGVTDMDNAASAGLMLSVDMEEIFENAQHFEGGEVPGRTFRWRRPGPQD